MKSSKLRILFWFISMGLTFQACGGAQFKVEPTSEFTEKHSRLFENGIDFVQNPAVLVGQWQEAWYRDHAERIEHSDLIAEMTITTFRIDTDPEQQQSYRLVGSIDDVIYGKIKDDDISMVVNPSHVGFETVDGNERRILNKRFVAFIKWYTDEEDKDDLVIARWHLAPASQPIIDRTIDLIGQRTHKLKKGEVIIYQR